MPHPRERVTGGGGHSLLTAKWTLGAVARPRLEVGGLLLVKDISEGGLSEGDFPMGAVVGSLFGPRKASRNSCNQCFIYSYTVVGVNVSG